MDTLIMGTLLIGASYVAYRGGKREGSRKGYSVGRRRERSRTRRTRVNTQR